VAAIILGKIYRIPTVIEYHASYDALVPLRFRWLPNNWKYFVFRLVSNGVNRKATAVCANTELLAKSIQAQGFSRKVYFYNPAVIVRRYKRRSKQITFSFIGRLSPTKGASYVVDTACLIKTTLVKHRVRILIAGKGSLRRQLAQLIQDAGLSMVQILGPINRWKVLAETDYLIATSMEKPTLEMTIVEALALGIPTICFGAGAYPETVIDRITGYKVMPGDIQALAQVIGSLVNRKPNRHMADEARQLFKAKYSLPVQLRRVETMYREILNLKSYNQ
jgi:glycosyltransferase involved in cell wall biosynthesis